MKTKNNPKIRTENIVIQEMDKEVLIYDLSENKAYCLNEASSLIWKLCDGNHSLKELTKIVGNQLDSSIDESYIWIALDQLKRNNLLLNADKIPTTYLGESRREVIKKIGLTSMVAFPLITSAVSPVSVQAASCASVGVSVGVAADCSTLNDLCCSMNSVAFAGAGNGQFACGCTDACVANGQPVGSAADCSTLAPLCCSMNAVPFAMGGPGQFACGCQP